MWNLALVSNNFSWLSWLLCSIPNTTATKLHVKPANLKLIFSIFEKKSFFQYVYCAFYENDNQSNHSPGKKEIQGKVRENNFWWKNQGNVSEILEKLSKLGENKIVLENVDITCFFYHISRVINATFCYIADQLESGENIVSQGKVLGNKNLKIMATLIHVDKKAVEKIFHVHSTAEAMTIHHCNFKFQLRDF